MKLKKLWECSTEMEWSFTWERLRCNGKHLLNSWTWRWWWKLKESRSWRISYSLLVPLCQLFTFINHYVSHRIICLSLSVFMPSTLNQRGVGGRYTYNKKDAWNMFYVNNPFFLLKMFIDRVYFLRDWMLQVNEPLADREPLEGCIAWP